MNRVRSLGVAALLVGLALSGCGGRGGGASAPAADRYSDDALIGAKPPGTNAIIIRAFGVGSGSIAVTGAALNCFDPHEEDYVPHEARQVCWAYIPTAVSSVSVTAAALSGSMFAGWTSGPCTASSEPTCAIQLGSDQKASVRFDLATVAPRSAFTIRAEVLGFVDGKIGATAIPPPPGGLQWTCNVFDPGDRVNVRRSCSAAVPAGTRVTLEAMPAQGTEFVGWRSACSGTGPCILTMDGDMRVVAAFAYWPGAAVTVRADTADSTTSSVVDVVNVARGAGPARPIGQTCRAVDGRNFILGLDVAGNVVHFAVYFPPRAAGDAQIPELSLGTDSTALGLLLASFAGIIDDGGAAALVEPWIRAQPEFALVAQAVRALVEARGYLDPAAPEAAQIRDAISQLARRVAERVVFQPQAPAPAGVCALRELIGSCYIPGKGIRVDWVPDPAAPCRRVQMTLLNPNPHWTKIVFSTDRGPATVGGGVDFAWLPVLQPSRDVTYLSPKDWVPDADFASVAESVWSYVDAVVERSLDPLDFEATPVTVELPADATELTLSAVDRDPWVIVLNGISGMGHLFAEERPGDLALAVEVAVDVEGYWETLGHDPLAFIETMAPKVAGVAASELAQWLKEQLLGEVTDTGLEVAAFSAGLVKDAVYAPFYAFNMLSDGQANVSIPASSLFGATCGHSDPPINRNAVSGSVTGVVAGGVTVSLSGLATGTVVTDSSGSFSFGGLADGTYTVTPSVAGYVFDPASLTVTVAGADVTGLAFIATFRDYEWSFTGSMTAARIGHTATLLPSGRVLVTGGQSYPWWVLEQSAELYDPGSGIWTRTAAMASARGGHTATLLYSGEVLVAGGGTASAELYDPSTATWRPTGSMSAARRQHTATLLPSGKVLVVGGGNDGLASAELYDPASGQWTPTGSMSTPRTKHVAALLDSGKVLVAGGYRFPINLASAEVYDPATGLWSGTGALVAERVLATATVLGSGKVLVAGGESYGLRVAELYDPALGTWSATGSLSAARGGHTATLLPDGKVLVVGGALSALEPAYANAELYDPAAGSWSVAGRLATARKSHTATLLPAGEVLVAGGLAGTAISTAELTR